MDTPLNTLRTSPPPRRRASIRARRPVAAVLAAVVAFGLAACESDVRSPAGVQGAGGDAGAGASPLAPVTGGAATPSDGSPGEPSGNGAYTLRALDRNVDIVEGGDGIAVSIELARSGGYDLPVALTLEGASPADVANLGFTFADESLGAGDTSTVLNLSLGIGTAPLLPGMRTLTVIGTDGTNPPVAYDIVLEVEPTQAPDVYLLVGQSNMDGFSELDARDASPGGPDATDPRIFQLNVTGNDAQNYMNESDFTDPASVIGDPAFTLALDPLHDGFAGGADGKAGRRIGPGLSFAKAMLPSTTADIVLVPAAWPDTGFCSRDTNLFEDLGWLAAPRADDAFAGTLLHDRAIERANLAIAGVGGVLRGILWHQGEADAGDPACAAAYADNLSAMVASLRAGIVPDARGPTARGPDALIPFVVGTMAMGSDARGSQLPFPDIKQVVDAAHRNVADEVPFSTFVNADDLVPPAYPCGEGSCVHFGAAAQRELGARYAERLQALTGG